MAASFSLAGTLRIVPSWVDTLTATTVTDTATAQIGFTLTDGTGNDQANAGWRDKITVAAGQTATVTLSALTLNLFGGTGTLSLASQKVLLARNLSTTTAVTVALGTAVTASLGPGGVVYATRPATGWAATTLTITNAGAAAADVELYLVGVKA